MVRSREQPAWYSNSMVANMSARGVADSISNDILGFVAFSRISLKIALNFIVALLLPMI